MLYPVQCTRGQMGKNLKMWATLARLRVRILGRLTVKFPPVSLGKGENRAVKQLLSIGLITVFLLTGCSIPRVSAEQRLFLDLSVEFLGETVLPTQTISETTLGGLSAITYDRQRDRIYALSDDRGSLSPPRFYTLKATVTSTGFKDLTVESVTRLQDETGEPFGSGQLDPEGMALTPRGTLIISSEGSPRQAAEPFIGEFDLNTGQLQTRFRVPDRYLPDDGTNQTQGIQENLGFEALTLAAPPGITNYADPFRLFVATEGPLLQDLDADPEIPYKNRLLHYLIGQDQSTLLAEHWYPMDLTPLGGVLNGLSELLVLDPSGHFLALERSFGLQGFTIKLYQAVIGGATDTSAIATLQGDTTGITPIRKQLVANLNDLEIPLDNLEGMTLGPTLPDGNPSLILVSDNNFDDRQKTQFLLFRLRGISR
jgi:hypothetical protein